MISPVTDVTQVISSDVRQGEYVAKVSSSKNERIPALDFTKGALVLIMVLYHWLNYFIGPQGSYYEYLRFLPPSFIFITGFLISHVYLSKYQARDLRLPRRLVVRGLKIVGVFISLNAIISLLIPESSQARLLFDNSPISTLVAIFATGNFENGRPAAFYVLLPIGYLLMLSACLLIASRFYRGIFHVVCVLFLLGIFVLNLIGLKSGSLELLTIGLLGVSVGYIPIRKINVFLRHPYALVLAYVGYTIAIAVWNAGYPLQVVGVCLTLMLLYLLGSLSGESGRVQQSVILLGKYSLVGYIVQIAILQLLRRGLRNMNLEVWALGLSFVAAIALTLIAVEAVDRARTNAPVVNRLYAAVFA
ncbi:MAG TPA: acyltransferase family protein [Terriglobales bacterium]|jgi:peptidoglycan/LPS O-acetylase OafA/YrhL|nr:acyltransferase family protein [Terriglobales bacterium]